jgi:hypothetical protein
MVQSRICHAFDTVDNGEMQYSTALEIPPIKSPITAVRAAIVADAKKGKCL